MELRLERAQRLRVGGRVPRPLLHVLRRLRDARGPERGRSACQRSRDRVGSGVQERHTIPLIIPLGCLLWDRRARMTTT